MLFTGGTGDKSRVLAMACQESIDGGPGRHTKSNAATLRLFTGGSVSVASDSYRPTSRVATESLSGPRSVQAVLSLGFWDEGVKKLATAFSAGRQG